VDRTCRACDAAILEMNDSAMDSESLAALESIVCNSAPHCLFYIIQRRLQELRAFVLMHVYRYGHLQWCSVAIRFLSTKYFGQVASARNVAGAAA
jgi:hypothetical protein